MGNLLIRMTLLVMVLPTWHAVQAATGNSGEPLHFQAPKTSDNTATSDKPAEEAEEAEEEPDCD